MGALLAATCWYLGDIDDLIAGVELGIDMFDCALPTRLGRHGVARSVPTPKASGAWTWSKAGGASPPSRFSTAVRVRRVAGYTRAYLHYL